MPQVGGECPGKKNSEGRRSSTATRGACRKTAFSFRPPSLATGAESRDQDAAATRPARWQGRRRSLWYRAHGQVAGGDAPGLRYRFPPLPAAVLPRPGHAAGTTDRVRLVATLIKREHNSFLGRGVVSRVCVSFCLQIRGIPGVPGSACCQRNLFQSSAVIGLSVSNLE